MFIMTVERFSEIGCGAWAVRQLVQSQWCTQRYSDMPFYWRGFMLLCSAFSCCRYQELCDAIGLVYERHVHCITSSEIDDGVHCRCPSCRPNDRRRNATRLLAAVPIAYLQEAAPVPFSTFESPVNQSSKQQPWKLSSLHGLHIGSHRGFGIFCRFSKLSTVGVSLLSLRFR
jgi:hypothetical protein